MDEGGVLVEEVLGVVVEIVVGGDREIDVVGFEVGN